VRNSRRAQRPFCSVPHARFNAFFVIFNYSDSPQAPSCGLPDVSRRAARLIVKIPCTWHRLRIRRTCAIQPGLHQILQTFSRTIASPRLHPNPFANSAIFESGRFTRNFGTACGFVVAKSFSISGRSLTAQTCAYPRKNLCSGVNSVPSSFAGLRRSGRRLLGHLPSARPHHCPAAQTSPGRPALTRGVPTA
jgi:hypothetical protein